jgi:hypothetical protein
MRLPAIVAAAITPIGRDGGRSGRSVVNRADHCARRTADRRTRADVAARDGRKASTAGAPNCCAAHRRAGRGGDSSGAKHQQKNRLLQIVSPFGRTNKKMSQRSGVPIGNAT